MLNGPRRGPATQIHMLFLDNLCFKAILLKIVRYGVLVPIQKHCGSTSDKLLRERSPGNKTRSTFPIGINDEVVCFLSFDC